MRELVRDRAKGRCEYCGKPEGVNTFSHQVDHIIPENHTGTSEFHNLAWSCLRCNSTKGSEIASYDVVNKQLIPLYNPRIQNWDEHFEMKADASIEGKTPVGRVTVRILQMNHLKQLKTRRNLIESGLW
jgi:hypothetical protein